MASVFDRHRQSLHRNEMSRSVILSLVDRGTDALISGKLMADPFSDEMMEAAYETSELRQYIMLP